MTPPPCPAAGAGTHRGRLEVATILGDHIDAYQQAYVLGPDQSAVVRDVLRCRTAALGGHLEACSACGFERPAYNSCRNRHCPKCQAIAQARWVEARMRRVLPSHYFHVVFTLPSGLHTIARRNRALVFDLLLRCAADTLVELAGDPKWLGEPARIGVTTVLHTWTRDLRFHPHAHCIVTGGGLALDGSRWVAAPPDFLFPVRVLGALFRGKFLARLRLAHDGGRLALAPHETERDFRRRLRRLRRKAWVTYAKRPFGGPEQVHRYLGRYTHRVAISNARLVAAGDNAVTFRTRGNQTATLPPVEFVRRFLDHVLPGGFVKIRHYGLLASGNVATRLEHARALLGGGVPLPPAEPDEPGSDDWRNVMLELTGIDVRICPRCNACALQRLPLPSPYTHTTALASARAPPEQEVAA